MIRTLTQAQFFSARREPTEYSAQGEFVFISPPGIDERGYAVKWLLRVALPQLPALPERTCPLMRAELLGASAPSCDGTFVAVGVALKSS